MFSTNMVQHGPPWSNMVRRSKRVVLRRLGNFYPKSYRVETGPCRYAIRDTRYVSPKTWNVFLVRYAKKLWVVKCDRYFHFADSGRVFRRSAGLGRALEGEKPYVREMCARMCTQCTDRPRLHHVVNHIHYWRKKPSAFLFPHQFHVIYKFFTILISVHH